MKISQQELDRIIKEEMEAAIEEGFLDRVKSSFHRADAKQLGWRGIDSTGATAKADALRDKSAAEKAKKKGRRRRKKADSAARSSGQTYPATELTALAATLRNVASKSGVPFPGSRGNMVKAFEKVLRSGGYALDEAKDERVFIGQKGNIEISASVAPDLVKWLGKVKEEAPDVFARVVQELGNYRFDVPAELAPAEAAASEEGEDLRGTRGGQWPPGTAAWADGQDGDDELGDPADLGHDPPPGDAIMKATGKDRSTGPDSSASVDSPEAEERQTVALFKGKGGVSLQSFIDRLGGDDPEVKGIVRSTVLKHISNQMKKQGVQIVEDEGPTDYRMIAEEFLNSLDEAAVAIYNHPAGKQYSLNAALQKLRADGSTGIEKEKLGKLLDALARWAKSQGLKVNEAAPPSHSLQESITINRWKVLSGVK
tara:strand:- start:15 stop:1295 length:1281 start_codon:yes stop_codon:yes gene_type:complete